MMRRPGPPDPGTGWGGGAVECAGLENRSRENVSHEQHDTCDDGSDALAPDLRTDPELAAVVEAWRGLPAAIRTAIVAVVRATMA